MIGRLLGRGRYVFFWWWSDERFLECMLIVVVDC